MNSASPFVNAALDDDDKLVRMVLDRPKANVLAMATRQAVAKVLGALDRQYGDPVVGSRGGGERAAAYPQRRKPVREAR